MLLLSRHPERMRSAAASDGAADAVQRRCGVHFPAMPSGSEYISFDAALRGDRLPRTPRLRRGLHHRCAGACTQMLWRKLAPGRTARSEGREILPAVGIRGVRGYPDSRGDQRRWEDSQTPGLRCRMRLSAALSRADTGSSGEKADYFRKALLKIRKKLEQRLKIG